MKNMDGSNLSPSQTSNTGITASESIKTEAGASTSGTPTMQALLGQRRSLGRIRSTRLLNGLFEEGASESEAVFLETLSSQGEAARTLWSEIQTIATTQESIPAETIQSIMQRVSAACSARVNVPELVIHVRASDPWIQAGQWYGQLAAEAQRSSVPMDSLRAVVLAGVFITRSRIKDPLLRACAFEKWLSRAPTTLEGFDTQGILNKAMQDSWNELRTRAMAEISAHQERKLNLRREKIVELARQLPVLRIQDVIRHLPGVPRRTLERDLQVLARELRLKPRGEKKGRTYTLAT